MHPLPISLIVPVSSYFKRDRDFHVFIAFVATCSNNLQNIGIAKPEPIRKIRKIRNESDESPEIIPETDIYYGRGIFPSAFNNKEMYKIATQIFSPRMDFIDNPDLMNEHPIALEIAAWYWTSEKLHLYGTNVNVIADKMKMTIDKSLFDKTLLIYENYLSKKGFKI